MSETPMTPAESGPERIHTKEEILALMGRWCENLGDPDIKEDADGIYELAANTPETSPGEFDRYIYSRKGTFGKNQASKMTIEVYRYLNNEPVGGDSLTDYDIATDSWISR